MYHRKEKKMDLKLASRADLTWVMKELKKEFDERASPEDGSFWFNRDIISKDIDHLCIVRNPGSRKRLGFLLYNKGHTEMVILWIHPSHRHDGIGKDIVHEHIEKAINAGRTIDFVLPIEESLRFWAACGYTKRKPPYCNYNDSLEKDLLHVPIKRVRMTGNFPKDPQTIKDMLTTTQLPFFATTEIGEHGIITFDKGKRDLMVESNGDWKLYNVTLKEITVLRGLLAAHDIGTHFHSVQVDRGNPNRIYQP